jgi:predicted MFS family arabinose efflux permease
VSTESAKTAGYRSLLTVSFTALLAGQIGSILGDRLHHMAFIELIAAETSRFADPASAFELSKLALAVTLPSILLGPVAGAYVDRADRKRVLIVTDVLRGLAVLAIPFMRPALPLWTVYVAVLGLYIANVFFLPARCAIVSEMVPRSHLIRANSLLTLGATAATIVGFGIGGVVAARAGWRITLFINAAAYFASAAALTLVRTRIAATEPSHMQPPSGFRIIREALVEVRRRSGARVGVLAPPLMVMAAAVTYVLGVAIIERANPEGTIHIGLLASLAGIGMALGSYTTGRVLGDLSRVRLIALGSVFAILPLAVIGLTHSLLLMGAAVAIAGFAAGPAFVSSETSVQEEAPRRRQATIFALRDMSMRIATIAGAALAPGLAALVGLRPALLILLAICIGIALPVLKPRR